MLCAILREALSALSPQGRAGPLGTCRKGHLLPCFGPPHMLHVVRRNVACIFSSEGEGAPGFAATSANFVFSIAICCAFGTSSNFDFDMCDAHFSFATFN